MRPLLAIGGAILLLGLACSKKKDSQDNVVADDDGKGAPPPVTEIKPPSPSNPGAISRQQDGLWYEQGKSTPFTGRIVHTLEETRYEEKFEKGVRVFVRAWDKDGKPLALHAWNADGSPKN